MIIEIRDILDNKTAIAHTQMPPGGTTLGYIFDQRDELKALKPCIAQVRVDGVKVENWEQSEISHADKIEIDIAPKWFLPPIIQLIIQIALIVAAVVQLIVSLVNRPKPAKLDTPKETSTYSWDGLKTSYSPGGPVPVIYGQHASGGQLISLAIDVDPNQSNKQLLSMLLGEGCGTITSVDCIKVNGIAFSNFNNPLPQSAICQAAADRYFAERPDVAADPNFGVSAQGAYDHYITFGQYEGMTWHSELCTTDPLNVSWDWRNGAQNQSAIPGFQENRNTFADGREISSLAITYATQGNQVAKVQLQVAALQGLGIFLGGTNPRLATQTVRYRVEYRRTGTSTYTTLEDRPFTAADRGEVWDAPVYNLAGGAACTEAASRYWADYPDVAADPFYGASAANAYQHYLDNGISEGRAWHAELCGNAWDIRLTWLSKDQAERGPAKGDTSFHHIWLRNVTEIRTNQVETYSSTALLGIKAVATNQLQGGQPNITALFRGRDVRCYSDLTTFVTTWTRNPAWCLLDYMTNSIYGMGPYTPNSAINIQSFIDFATLCNSQVSNGAGGLEPQHYLDLVMDKKKPHWQWVQDILGLYRSAMIFSQGKFKIISDRADLPLRQVFHAGNIVPGTFQMTMGTTDPTRPNQVNISFTNANQDYNMDTLFIQDSASIYGRNEPIKDVDLSLIGVTRETEVIREGYWQLARRRQTVREYSFETGLEALAVELGDKCQVGMISTNFELGYGGRIMEGDAFNVVLDREITVTSGFTYDFYLWHTASDTPEVRTVATTPGAGNISRTTITVSTTNPWNIPPANGDRWAIGITSEDLRTCLVKKIGFDPQTARHKLTAEEYIPVLPLTPTAVSTTPFYDLNAPPPQPISVRGQVEYNSAADGTLLGLTTIDVVPAPIEEGGQIRLFTGSYAQLSGSHCPLPRSLNGDLLIVQTGSAIGGGLGINTWTGTPSYVAYYELYFDLSTHPVNSGDYYTLYHRGGFYDGFDLYRRQMDVENLALFSEVLGDAVWNKSSVDYFTDATTAPNGTMTADKIIETSLATGRSHYMSQSLSVVTSDDIRFSCYIKPLERSWVFLQVAANSWAIFSALQAWFNVSSGTIGTTLASGSMSGVSAQIDSAAYGFYRCSVGGNVGPHSAISAYMVLADHDGGNVYVGTSGTGAYFWGAQVEENDRVSTYIQTSSSPVAVSPSTDYTFVGPVLGTHWEESAEVNSKQAIQYKIVPFNTRGARNYVGDWELVMHHNGDYTAPNKPSGLVAQTIATGVQLKWDVNSDSDILDYGVYASTTNAFGTSSLLARIQTTAYVDPGGTNADTFYYWIRAFDTSNNVSPIHPDSTAGKGAYKGMINQYVELTNTNCIALTTDAFNMVVATVGFVSLGGTITIEGRAFTSALTNIGSNTVQFKLQYRHPSGSNSWATLSTQTQHSINFLPFTATPVATMAGSRGMQMDFRLNARDVIGAGDFYTTDRYLKASELVT